MKKRTTTYLWSAQSMCVGDEALLVCDAPDILKCTGIVPMMKVIPVKISKYDKEKKEWYIDCYTIENGKYVLMNVSKDENGNMLHYIVANTATGILGRLIPYEWSTNLNNKDDDE